jgi:hypothetical protein
MQALGLNEVSRNFRIYHFSEVLNKPTITIFFDSSIIEIQIVYIMAQVKFVRVLVLSILCGNALAASLAVDNDKGRYTRNWPVIFTQ